MARRVARSTTTYGYRKALKEIRVPGKRASVAARKAHKKMLEDLLQREKGLIKPKTPTKKNAEKALKKEDEDYEVERLLDSRNHKGTLQFYVLWKGYPLEDSSWEPHHPNLDTSDELIQEYFEANPTKPGGAQAVNRRGRPSH